MTEFTVDAVLAFDTNSQPYRFTSRAGCHPSAHTLHRESQAKPAERAESRSGWKMVQTAGAAIPALAWGSTHQNGRITYCRRSIDWPDHATAGLHFLEER